MKRTIYIRPEADADITNAAAEYEACRIGLGRKYTGTVRAVIARIELLPEMYGVVHRNVRAARIGRFRNVLYYIAFPDRIEIVAVVHGSRDSSVWKSRL